MGGHALVRGLLGIVKAIRESKRLLRVARPVETGWRSMVSDYIRAALKHAVFEQLPDGHWYGRIPILDQVSATAQTIDSCEEALKHALEDWMVYRATAQLPIPPIDGIQPISRHAA